MDRLFKGVIVCLSIAMLTGCAGSDRSPDPEPEKRQLAVDSDVDRSWRATLLRAEDLRRVDDELRDGLVSEDSDRRRHSIRALGRIGDPTMTAELIAAFDDSAPLVRAEAIFAAAISGADETITAIAAKRTDADLRVRAAVAVALGLFATPETHAPLADLLADETDSVRVAACYAVARLSDADAIAETLFPMIEDPDTDVVAAALYALSRLSSRIPALGFTSRFKIREKLVQLADSRIPGIQLLVAEGLYNPVAGEQADALHAMLKSDSIEVLLAIIRSTSFPGAPAFVIHEVTIKHNDPRVVLATILGLGRMRGDAVNELLLDFILNDSRGWLRAEAVRSLSKADRRSFLVVANGLSTDSRPLILAATAEGLYGHSGTAAAEYARRLFDTDDAWVKLKAIPAMASVEEKLGSVFRDLLPVSIGEQKLQIARAAGYRLAMTERPEDDFQDSLQLLGDLWSGATETGAIELQLAVIDAAAEGRHAAGAALVRQALRADDFGVRNRAASVLRASFGETATIDPPKDKPLAYYEEIATWADDRHAALITVERQGFVPGRFTIALDTEHAPMTAYRFARLANLGHYDNRRVDPFVPGLRLHSGRGAGDRFADESWRLESVFSLFGPGTVAAVGEDDSTLGEWLVTLGARPNYLGRYAPFGRVVQNLKGVASSVLPIDRVVSVRVYEGNGRETLPPLR